MTEDKSIEAMSNLQMPIVQFPRFESWIRMSNLQADDNPKNRRPKCPELMKEYKSIEEVSIP
jgi:hypothetical protein